MTYDVVIVGGGPAGLSAALALGRAKKRVLLCDAGPRRNAAAEHIQNFVTRDGTPPEEFRRIGREQLAAYPNVEIRFERVESVRGEADAFDVTIGAAAARARRLILCTGMVDETLPIEGFRELWGRSIFQCPYCHGWESRDRPWAVLASPDDAAHFLPFTRMLRSWSPDLVAFTNGTVELSADDRAGLAAANVPVETSPIVRLVPENGGLAAIELADGKRVPREVLFARPPQHQVDIVRSLDLALDDDGFVRVDPMRRETSRPGIHAAGDLTTRMQSAIIAAAAGMHAAAVINMELSQ